MDLKISVFWWVILYRLSSYGCATEKVTCEPVARPQYGLPLKYTYDPDENGEYPVATTVYFRCYPGYELHGRSQVICLRGTWQYYELQTPKCIATCQTLGNRIPNGAIRYNVSRRSGIYLANTVASFICDSDYYISDGPHTRTCMDNKSWSENKNPTCSRGTCESLPSLRNGEITYDKPRRPGGGYPLFTTASFTCNRGFVNIRHSSISCQEAGNGTWTDRYGGALCSLRSCKVVVVPKWTAYSYSTKAIFVPDCYHCYESGTTLTISTCYQWGTKPDGPETRICQDNREWTGTLQACKKPKINNSNGHCFPAVAKVMLENGGKVTMSELQIGDRVQTVSSTGTITYSEVRAFLKKQPNKLTQCKSIATRKETITITGNHLIYARKTSADQFNPVYAGQLSKGDEVLIQKHFELSPEKVVNVSDISMQGAYVPLVPEGKIVVDGVLASCYADINHDVAHLTMLPMQRLSSVLEWIFGVDAGYPVLLSTARQVGMLLVPYVD